MHRHLPSFHGPEKGYITQFWRIQKVARVKSTIFAVFSNSYKALGQSKPDTSDLTYDFLQDTVNHTLAESNLNFNPFLIFC
jgi:hypothetical protein